MTFEDYSDLTEEQATLLLIEKKNSPDVDGYTALKLFMSGKGWDVQPLEDTPSLNGIRARGISEEEALALHRWHLSNGNGFSAAQYKRYVDARGWEQEDGMPRANDVASMDFVSLSDLEKKVFPEMKWIVDDLIPEGLVVLAGAPKIGKSFLCWNLALAVAQGGVFLSEFEVSQPKKVLYFALDNDPQRQIQNRLKMIQPDQSLPSNVLLCSNFPIRMQEEGLDTWEKTIKDSGAELVIVDTLKQVVQSEGRGSSYDQDYDMLRPVHAMVQRLGISMLLVTHTRKMVDVDNPFNMIQGSVGVQAACDTMLLLIKEDGDKMLHVNGREILPAEIGVEIKQGTFVATSLDRQEREENNLSDIRSEILAVVRDAGDNGLSMKGIVEALPERSENSVKLAVRRMVDEQIYQPKKRGKYYSSLPNEFQSEIADIPL